jgi:hypothetical protein
MLVSCLPATGSARHLGFSLGAETAATEGRKLEETMLTGRHHPRNMIYLGSKGS